jgi:hypothetical protein
MSADPYERCGLLGNPFVEEPDRPWTEPGWAERTPAGPPAAGQGLLIQFVGVKGAGKSTTLRRFWTHSPGPRRYVPPGPGRWRPLPVAPLVYWDELDRSPVVLRRAAWMRAARIRATVVAGTHVDLAAEAARAGLSVRTVELPPITVAELTRWAQARLAGVGGAGWGLPLADAARITAEAGASWRRAADLMHIWVAGEVAQRSRDLEVGYGEEGPHHR